MKQLPTTSRRGLFVTGVALSAALAGCTDGNESERTDPATDSSPEPTETTVQTTATTQEPTETAEPTDEPAPTLENFPYPDGSSRDGITGGLLSDTHRSTLRTVDSATLDARTESSNEDFDETVVDSNRVGSSGVLAEKAHMGNGYVQTTWSAADAQLAHVQHDSGRDERYRIDDDSPARGSVLRFSEFEAILRGTEWTEAVKVVETAAGEYGVVYESSGVADEAALLQIDRGDEIKSHEATVTVSETGHVSGLQYDLSVAKPDAYHGDSRRKTETTVGSVDETTVQEPEWIGTSREEGVRFEVAVTDDKSALEVEMVNGADVPSDALVFLTDFEGAGQGELSNPLTVGDRIYLGLAESGGLLIDTDGTPDDARELISPNVNLRMVLRGFVLLHSQLT